MDMNRNFWPTCLQRLKVKFLPNGGNYIVPTVYTFGNSNVHYKQLNYPLLFLFLGGRTIAVPLCQPILGEKGEAEEKIGPSKLLGLPLGVAVRI